MRGTNRIICNRREHLSSLEATVSHPGVPESVPQSGLKNTHYRLKPLEGRLVCSSTSRVVIRGQFLLVAMLLVCQMLAAKDVVVEKASVVAKIIGFQVPETFSFANDELVVPFCNSEFR